MKRISRGTFVIRMVILITIDIALYFFILKNINESEIFLLWMAYLLLIGLKFDQVVRRLHDINLSGYYALLGFVPIINLGGLVLFFIDGTEGPNKYGQDPLKRIGKEESMQSSKHSTPKLSSKLTVEQIEENLLLLEESYKDKILTKYEYESKKEEYMIKKDESIEKETNLQEFKAKKEKLNNLLENGIIRQEEYNSKLKSFTLSCDAKYEINELKQESMMFYIYKGTEHGPHSVKKIISLINSKEISPGILIRHEDEKNYNKRANELFKVTI